MLRNTVLGDFQCSKNIIAYIPESTLKMTRKLKKKNNSMGLKHTNVIEKDDAVHA